MTKHADGSTDTEYPDGGVVFRDRNGGLIGESPSRDGKYRFMQPEDYSGPEYKESHSRREIVRLAGFRQVSRYDPSQGSGTADVYVNADGCKIVEILNRPSDVSDFNEDFGSRFVANPAKDVAVVMPYALLGDRRRLGACRRSLAADLRKVR